MTSASIIEALRANPNATAIARQIGNVGPKAVNRLAKKANITLSRVGYPAKAQALASAIANAPEEKRY